MTIHIIMKNRFDCELDRKQVFHNETIRQALLSFISNHEAKPGDKYEIVESDDAFREFNQMKYHKED